MNARAVPGRDAPLARGLSEAQAGLWYAQRLSPDNPAFNTAHAVWIEGALDVAAFVRAADQAAHESDALALRIGEGAQSLPEQWVDPQHTPTMQVVDLSGHPDPAAAAREAMQRDRLSPVDPARDRLSQQRLFLLGPARSVWYLRVHHLATDGYGMGLLTERVCALYAGNAQHAGLAPLAPVLDEDLHYRDSERRTRDAAYWRDLMADAPAASGLQAALGAAAPDALRHVEPLGAALRARLHSAAAAIGQPWPDVLTALGAEYCRRDRKSVV